MSEASTYQALRGHLATLEVVAQPDALVECGEGPELPAARVEVGTGT